VISARKSTPRWSTRPRSTSRLGPDRCSPRHACRFPVRTTVATTASPVRREPPSTISTGAPASSSGCLRPQGRRSRSGSTVPCQLGPTYSAARPVTRQRGRLAAGLVPGKGSPEAARALDASTGAPMGHPGYQGAGYRSAPAPRTSGTSARPVGPRRGRLSGAKPDRPTQVHTAADAAKVRLEPAPAVRTTGSTNRPGVRAGDAGPTATMIGLRMLDHCTPVIRDAGRSTRRKDTRVT